ncbi:hypothetical protein MKEN_00457400 [Mycena kentingensis (nom. inval.)]|nr:hypothetical protein MKEN_00457400 [Mycena kentingensis (nom. inval.)]
MEPPTLSHSASPPATNNPLDAISSLLSTNNDALLKIFRDTQADKDDKIMELENRLAAAQTALKDKDENILQLENMGVAAQAAFEERLREKEGIITQLEACVASAHAENAATTDTLCAAAEEAQRLRVTVEEYKERAGKLRELAVSLFPPPPPIESPPRETQSTNGKRTAHSDSESTGDVDEHDSKRMKLASPPSTPQTSRIRSLDDTSRASSPLSSVPEDLSPRRRSPRKSGPGFVIIKGSPPVHIDSSRLQGLSDEELEAALKKELILADRKSADKSKTRRSHRELLQEVHRLEQRRANWIQLDSNRSRKWTDTSRGGIFALAPGEFLEVTNNTCIGAISLSETKLLGKDRVELGAPILAIGEGIVENDLVAALIRVPEGGNALRVRVSQFFKASADVVFPLPLPRDQPAPLSAEETPATFLALAGNKIAVGIMYAQWTKAAVYVFDWKQPEESRGPFPSGSTRVSFLSDTELLELNTTHTALNIRRLDGDMPGVVCCSFEIPPLRPGYRVVHSSFDCNAQRALDENVSWHSVRLKHLPEHALIYVSYTIAPVEAGTDLGDLATPVVMVIQRERFMAIRNDALSGVCTTLPWPSWGPQCARLVPTHNRRFCGLGIAGQRLIGLCKPPKPKRTSEWHLCLLDFNPHNIDHNANNKAARKVDSGTNKQKDALWAEQQEASRSWPFAAEIASEQAYIEFISTAKFEFDEVFMNDENVIGVKWAQRRTSGRLDVMYLG